IPEPSGGRSQPLVWGMSERADSSDANDLTRPEEETLLGAAPRRHVYGAVVLLVAVSALMPSSTALGYAGAKTASDRPQAKLRAIGIRAPRASRLSLQRLRTLAAEGVNVIITSPSRRSSARDRRLADLSRRDRLRTLSPRN